MNQYQLSFLVWKWNRITYTISQLQKNTIKYLANPLSLYFIAIEFVHQQRMFMSQMLSSLYAYLLYVPRYKKLSY